MIDTLDTSTEGLIDEIARYLAVVDVFRAEGREPIWRLELVTPQTLESRSAVRPAPASAH
jgi:hypothetical protein